MYYSTIDEFDLICFLNLAFFILLTQLLNIYLAFVASHSCTFSNSIHLSISGITKSIIAIIATRSPIFPPLAIWSNALRLLKPGDRNLILYGVVPPSLTIYTPNSPLAVSTLE